MVTGMVLRPPLQTSAPELARPYSSRVKPASLRAATNPLVGQMARVGRRPSGHSLMLIVANIWMDPA